MHFHTQKKHADFLIFFFDAVVVFIFTNSHMVQKQQQQQCFHVVSWTPSKYNYFTSGLHFLT